MDSLLDLLADHPLSVELIAPHLKELTPAEIRADFGGLLEKFANPDAREDRNKGLRASLEFSRRRLSQAAQATLPWLAWFEGGVFEALLLMFADLQPDVWHPIRTELEATALLKVETLEGFNTPYLRFHPTLRYAARPDEVPDPAAAAENFIGVYMKVMELADSLFKGQQPAAGMALMAREEANFRRAMQSAFARGLRSEMQNLADTLRLYLERAGRNRERDALTAWVRLHLPDDVLDDAACASIRQHAMTLLSQGQAQAALEMVQTLLARLLSAGLADGSDPALQIALTYAYLGRIFILANRPDLSLEPARAAVARFEKLSGDSARGNLSAVLGDLANTYRALGKFDQALEAAERGLALDRELGNNHEVATALAQIAKILADAHRYPEAQARYVEAMQAAQAAGDLELQGTMLQHQALLHREQGNYPLAVDLFKQAIALFQRVNAPAGEMHTCDLLATAESRRGELDAAEAWYGRARQLAGQLHDRAQLATIAQNLGILYQIRAAALAQADPSHRLWLDKAVASVQESLEIWLATDNQVNVAASYSQLGILQQMHGNLDAAEQNALKALQIRESLDHPDTWKDYLSLAEIFRARGDEKSAAAWQAKYETKYAEIKRREQGVGEDGVRPAPRFDEQLIKFLTELAQACYAVRAQKVALPPELAEALAQLHDAQAPFPEIGDFLQAAASGPVLPPFPSGLPKQVSMVLEALKEAIEEIK